MARGWIHTVFRDGRWVNVREGEAQPLSSHLTKADAVAQGRRLAVAAQTEHVIHRKDGTIETRNSYGNDPYPPRG